MSRRTFQRIIALAIIAASLVGVVGLFVMRGDSAEDEAIQFIAMINSGLADQTYEQSSPQLRDQASQERWTAYVNQLSGKLGEPVLVAKKDGAEGTRFYAFEALVNGISHTYVVELEDSTGDWLVRHIDVEYKAFESGRFFPEGEN